MEVMGITLVAHHMVFACCLLLRAKTQGEPTRPRWRRDGPFPFDTVDLPPPPLSEDIRGVIERTCGVRDEFCFAGRNAAVTYR